MRDILFRAWDKQRREYLSGGEVFIAIQPGKCPKNIFYLDILKDPNRYKDRFELEQYTGRKDKNGNKIFEGDIFHLGDINIKYIVCWHDTGFMGKQSVSTSFVGLSYWKDNIEVIGNIHDNPDLLKSEKE